MTRTTSIITAVFAAAALAAGGGGSSEEDLSDTVKFTDCTVFPDTSILIAATLTNPTDTTADVTVNFEVASLDGKTRIGTNSYYAEALAPGQSVDHSEQLIWPDAAGLDSVTCTALSVEVTP